MKKTTTITKEYNEDGKLIKETTIIVEEDYSIPTNPTIAPITTPYIPQSPFEPYKPYSPFYYTITCSDGDWLV